MNLNIVYQFVKILIILFKSFRFRFSFYILIVALKRLWYPKIWSQYHICRAKPIISHSWRHVEVIARILWLVMSHTRQGRVIYKILVVVKIYEAWSKCLESIMWERRGLPLKSVALIILRELLSSIRDPKHHVWSQTWVE